MHEFSLKITFSFLIFASLLWEIQPAATYLTEKINPKIAQRITRLRNSFTDLPASTLIIVDGDNVRGKTKFSASKEQLCKDLDLFVSSSGISGRVVLMYDHGNEHEAFMFNSLAVCFSGPGRTADDVIARDLIWFQRRFNCGVVVVTADTGLKTRCFQGGRATGQQVTIVDSTQFVELLGSTIANMPIQSNSSVLSTYSDISHMGVPINEETPKAILSVEAMRPFTSDRMNVLRRELGVRNQIRSIEKFVKGGCGKKKMVKLQKRAAELDKRLKKVISDESVSLGATLDDAMKMSPEFQEAGYNALVGMLRAGSTRGREETWERVLLAERFRNTLLANQISKEYHSEATVASAISEASSVSAVEEGSSVGSSEDSLEAADDVEVSTRLPLGNPLETYIEEINKNYSKTNTTAELQRWLQRKENSTLSAVELVLDAGSTTSETATLVSDSAVSTAENFDVSDVEPVINSVFLIIEVPFPSAPKKSNEDDKGATKLSPIHEQILLQQQRLKNEQEIEEKRLSLMTEEERRAPVRSPRALTIMAKSLAGSRQSHNVPFEVTVAGSRVYDLETLSRCSSFKKNRGEKKEMKAESIGSVEVVASGDASGSLRIVCVSDTHGMENILSGSVPDGDIFIHAGDFAADKGKSRLKLKQLDEWMSKLPHELKIVVRGNHDPSGGSFPLSKAIYAERASTIMFRGVAIGLAPHGTITVPQGNIIVSHEPPYGVLDQALGKKKPHVGSHYLQKSVMRMADKPQLWIFGHIHEGFGAIRTTFGAKGLTVHPKGSPVYSSTLCVNAANSNPGPAHSIDNLPICIDIKKISNEKDTIEDGNEMVENTTTPALTLGFGAQ